MTTIIILLILAGIAISQLTGSGLFENSRLAKEKYENAHAKEDDILKQYENAMNDVKISSNREDTISKEDYNKLLKRVEELEKISVNNLELDYDNKKDIKLYNSNTNKYTVPSSGIIIAKGYSTLNNTARITINNITNYVCGFGIQNGTWAAGSYSQLVTKGCEVYFTIPTGTEVEVGYFIPFKQ